MAAIWRKVIVSGSNAELATLKVDNLTSGSVVIGGGSTSNLTVTAINGTGSILATTGATGVIMTGAFTGSFSGSFTGTIEATASIAISASYAALATSASYASGSTSASYATTASYVINAASASYATSASYLINGATASYATSASVAISSSFATTASYLTNALTFGVGLSGSNGSSSYNGSTPITITLSGSAFLTTNLVSKWTGTGLVNSNITDTGNQVQIGAAATGGLSVAAGGISVTGDSNISGNLLVTGDFTVAGTASFINSDNLTIKDKFILINSGSTTLADSGWVTQYSSSGVGSAFYLESSTGAYGRFAIAYDVSGSTPSVTPDEYVVSAKINQASIPSATPTWGAANGTGNMWITNAGDVYIYS